MLSKCGILIDKQLTRVNGRILNAPTLKVGNQECIPRNGRWNFNDKTLWEPINLQRWAIVNFSLRCDMSYLPRELIYSGKRKGIIINRPHALIDEDCQWVRSGPAVRVERMFEKVMARLPGPPEFLLCILPEKKSSDIYGPWKKKNLHEIGIVTQCIAPKKNQRSISDKCSP